MLGACATPKLPDECETYLGELEGLYKIVPSDKQALLPKITSVRDYISKVDEDYQAGVCVLGREALKGIVKLLAK